MKNPFLLGALAVLIILIAGLFYYEVTDWFDFNQTQISSSQKTTSPSSTLLAPKPIPSQTPAPIPEDWETFSSETFGISVKHPKDFTAEETQEGVRVLKLGPTQSLGTELYDGISILIRTGSLEGVSLEKYVDLQIQEIKDQPINAKVSEKREVKVLELNGFSYNVSSLGEATYILLPKGQNQYLEIINSTVDPSNFGYQKTVDLIISSLEF
jgi:hypothetical protein